MTGTLISAILAHYEELLREIEYQLNLGPDSLDEQDWFLLECNFDELITTAGEDQEYWLLAIQTAREVSHICSMRVNTDQHCEFDQGWRWAFY
jgi:hypothetical protein